MLAKKYRLPIQSLPQKALKSAKTPYFLVKVYPAGKSFSRFGTVINKKFDKKATIRNFWKRRVFSVFQKWPRNESCPKDLLLVFYPELKKLSYQKLESEINKLK